MGDAQDITDLPDNESIQSYRDIKFVYMMRDYSNPISIEEVNEATNAVMNSYMKERGESSKPLIYSVLEMAEGDVILAYCFRIDGEGLTSSYTGQVSKNDGKESLSRIRENAADWYKNQVLDVAEDTTDSNNLSLKDAERFSTIDNPLENGNDNSNVSSLASKNVPALGSLTIFCLIGIACLTIKREEKK